MPFVLQLKPKWCKHFSFNSRKRTVLWPTYMMTGWSGVGKHSEEEGGLEATWSSVRASGADLGRGRATGRSYLEASGAAGTARHGRVARVARRARHGGVRRSAEGCRGVPRSAERAGLGES